MLEQDGSHETAGVHGCRSRQVDAPGWRGTLSGVLVGSWYRTGVLGAVELKRRNELTAATSNMSRKMLFQYFLVRRRTRYAAAR